MPISHADIGLIENTEPLFSKTDGAVAALFYERLFELAPDLRTMFPTDMSEQHRKLSATLAVAISAMRDWQELAPILAALARRHIVYGVLPWHYAIVSQALLDTLRAGGVDEPTVKAWNRAMSHISTHMIACAYSGGAQPAPLHDAA